MKRASILLLLMLAVGAFGQTRMVMLTINHTNKPSDELILEPYEIVEIKSSFDYTAGGSYEGNAQVHVQKGTDTFAILGDRLNPNFGNQSRGPIVLTGPATIKLLWRGPQQSGNDNAFVTVEIKPASFPPDKTFNLPAGTGARVALECSTNLTQWAELYSVTETNSPTHKFFRIKADRIR